MMFDIDLLETQLYTTIADMETVQVPSYFFVGGTLFLYALVSIVSRMEFHLKVNTKNPAENKKLSELPIIFRIFPISYIFIYDAVIVYDVAPLREIARFTMPTNVVQLKWFVEQLHYSLTVLLHTRATRILEINEIREDDEDTADYLERGLGDLNSDIQQAYCLLLKAESLLLVLLPTYERKF